MFEDMKQEAKKEQLKRLIAAMNDKLLEMEDDEEDPKDLEEVVREDIEKDMEEDPEVDEVVEIEPEDEDEDEDEDDEESMMKEDMQNFLGGSYMIPEELMGKKSKRLMMDRKPEVRIDAMFSKMEARPKKRGRKKKA